MVYIENNTQTQRVYIPRRENGVAYRIPGVLTDLYVTENGQYEPHNAEGFSAVTVSVPQESYSSGYTDGFAAGYASGETEGYSEGEEAQKGKLTAITASTNGNYEREDGYSSVFVNVEGGGDYSSGYTDGFQAGYASGETEGVIEGKQIQKSLMEEFTATTNGYYTRSDGWNALLVEVPQTGSTSVLVPITADTNQTYYPAAYSADGFSEVAVHVDTQPYYDQGFQAGYASGLTEGAAAQKALLGDLSANTNGTYTSANGYSGVTVNVPITGETYPRSNITIELNSDDYEGLSGLTIHFDAFGSPYSAFTVTDSATTAFTATYNPGVTFHIYATTPVGYQGEIQIYDTTYWGSSSSYQVSLNRYQSGATTVVTARTTNDVTQADFVDNMKGLVYNGSASAWTAPTGVTYDSGEDKWYLEYPGTIVKGFHWHSSNDPLRNKIISLETPSELSVIGGFNWGAYNLESVYGHGITEVGDCVNQAPADAWGGFDGCTALTSFTSSVTVKKVGYHAFQDCYNLSEQSMFSIEQLEYIGPGAFQNCWSITGSVTVNTPVIMYQAFSMCTGITQLYIGENVTTLETSAFEGCTTVNWLWCWPSTAPALSSIGSFNFANEGTLFHRDRTDYSTWFAKLPNWSEGLFT